MGQMLKAAVVIDNWKLGIFKRHLDAAKFEYEQLGGITPDTLILRVQTTTAETLAPVVRAAMLECVKTNKETGNAHH